jgi:hypothetical protein
MTDGGWLLATRLVRAATASVTSSSVPDAVMPAAHETGPLVRGYAIGPLVGGDPRRTVVFTSPGLVASRRWPPVDPAVGPVGEEFSVVSTQVSFDRDLSGR